MLVIVCYDVVDDRRRLNVSNELENFGVRVQFSVFECHLDENQVRTLQRRLGDLVDSNEDKVRYYVLCAKDEKAVIVDGRGQLSRDWDYHIV